MNGILDHFINDYYYYYACICHVLHMNGINNIKVIDYCVTFSIFNIDTIIIFKILIYELA